MSSKVVSSGVSYNYHSTPQNALSHHYSYYLDVKTFPLQSILLSLNSALTPLLEEEGGKEG